MYVFIGKGGGALQNVKKRAVKESIGGEICIEIQYLTIKISRGIKSNIVALGWKKTDSLCMRREARAKKRRKKKQRERKHTYPDG